MPRFAIVIVIAAGTLLAGDALDAPAQSAPRAGGISQTAAKGTWKHRRSHSRHASKADAGTRSTRAAAAAAASR